MLVEVFNYSNIDVLLPLLIFNIILTIKVVQKRKLNSTSILCLYILTTDIYFLLCNNLFLGVLIIDMLIIKPAILLKRTRNGSNI